MDDLVGNNGVNFDIDVKNNKANMGNRNMLSDTDMDKSETLCGRKRTFKNTKSKGNSNMKKSNSQFKESEQLIVPEAI